MRSILITLSSLLIITSCQKKFEAKSNEIVRLVETDSFIVYTSKKQWSKELMSQISDYNIPHNESVSVLLESIKSDTIKGNIFADKIGERLQIPGVINHIAADLLEQDEASVYSKITESNESVALLKTVYDRKFWVQKQVVLYVSDLQN